jgi:hypothetical protein
MLDIIRKGKMPGALRYKIIETGLVGGVTPQAFPGDTLNGQRIVEFILVLVSPAGCIRLHCSAPG